MRYLVYRLDTAQGPHYQIVKKGDDARSRAVCVGELEAATRTGAVFHLRHSLKVGLGRHEAFFPTPAF